MKFAVLFAIPMFVACSGSAPRAEPADGPLPELFTYAYEYSGSLEGTSVAGRVSFEQGADDRVRYTVEVDGAGNPCRGYLRSVTEPNIRLGCKGLVLELVRLGEVANPLLASLQTTRRVDRQECGRWAVDPRTKQRVCVHWETVSVNVPVTYRGQLNVRALDF